MSVDLVTVVAELRDDLSPGLAKARAQLDAFQGSVDATSDAGNTLGATLGGTRTEVEDLGSEASKSQGWLSGLMAGFGGVTTKVRETTGALADAGEKLASAGNEQLGGLLEFAKKPLEILGLGETGLLAAGYEYTKNVQTAKAAITQAAGGGPNGNKLFASVEGLEGPFNMTSLQSATTTLLGAGASAKQAQAEMKELANLSAMKADPNSAISGLATTLGRIQSTNEVTTKSLTSFSAQGVDALGLLAQKLHTTRIGVQQMVAANEINGAQFVAAFTAGQGPLAKFNDGLKQSRQTLSGMADQLKLTVEQSSGTLIAPLTGELQKVLPSLTAVAGKTITALAPAISSLAGGLGSALTGLLPAVTPLVGGLTAGLAKVFSAIGPAFGHLGPEIVPLSKALTSLLGALAPVIPELIHFGVAMIPLVTTGIKIAATIAKVIIPVFGAFTESIGWVFDKVGPLKDAVGGLVAVILTLHEVRDVSKVFKDLGIPIFDTTKLLVNFTKDLISNIAANQRLIPAVKDAISSQRVQATATNLDATASTKLGTAEARLIPLTATEATDAGLAATAEDAQGAAGDVDAAGSLAGAAGSSGLLAKLGGMVGLGGAGAAGEGAAAGGLAAGASTAGVALLGAGALYGGLELGKAISPSVKSLMQKDQDESTKQLTQQADAGFWSTLFEIDPSAHKKAAQDVLNQRQRNQAQLMPVGSLPTPNGPAWLQSAALGQRTSMMSTSTGQPATPAAKASSTGGDIHLNGPVTINVQGATAAEVAKSINANIKSYTAQRLARGR